MSIDTTLYFQQGSSDKQYRVWMVEDETQSHFTNWAVHFAYGRRGGPQKQAVKKSDMLKADAEQLAMKMLHAKTLKGYTAGQGAEAYSDNDNAGELTGLIPQLLNPVKSDAEAIALYTTWGPALMMQVKFDGENRPVATDGGTVKAGNRKGTARELPMSIVEALKTLDYFLGSLELWTEDMGDHLVIFDVTRIGEADLSKSPNSERGLKLQYLWEEIVHNGLDKQLQIATIHQPESQEDILDFIDTARDANEEGVVFRDGRGIHEPGRPNSGGPVMKLVFKARATVEVLAQNEKRSVQCGVLNAQGALEFVGNCIVPTNWEVPEVGTFIDVEYMNIMRGEGAKLYQPQYKGPRTDKTEADFHSSLKFKKTA